MTEVVEHARAKINLTLSVLGRRSDGYHALLSLVAFADAGDLVRLVPCDPAGVTATGPFAAAITGENLADRALRILAETDSGLKLGHVFLQKDLPVAAGIGGGSSDAAAVLRAVRRTNPDRADCIAWEAVAQRLGADVPVCFADRAGWMSGTGDLLHALASPLPPLAAVLVNPMSAVPADKTAHVFRLLGAPPLTDADSVMAPACPSFPGRAELLALMARAGNDLEVPATAGAPEIGDVLAALETCEGVAIAQMTGAGPTCFGIFADAAAAEAAALQLTAAHPGWWVRATTLR